MKVKPKGKYRPEFTQKDRQACRAVMAWTLDKDKALSRVTFGEEVKMGRRRWWGWGRGE